MAAIPIRTFFFNLFFIFKSPQRSLLQFESIGLSGQEKTRKKKIDFQDGRGGHLGFPIGTILAIFYFQVTRCFLPSFESIGLSGQEKKRKKNRFSRWPRRPSWISDRNDFSFFDLQVTRCFLLSFESIGLSLQEKKRKKDFPDGRHGGLLGYPIIKILALFYL